MLFGEDEKGSFIGLTGIYRYTVAFSYNYTATPVEKLYEGASIFSVSLSFHNLKESPMPFLVLEHINYRPVNDGQLVQSVICDPSNMRVRANIPAFMEVAPGYREFFQVLQHHPEKHLTFTPDLVYDPEMVLYFNYLSDDNGWARTMQIHPDGSADIVRHRPGQLNRAVRGIFRTVDKEALGIEPGTAEVEGFTSEKGKGNLQSLPGGSKFTVDLEIGVLSNELVQHEESLVEATIAAGK